MATLTITDLAAEWQLIKLLDSALPLIPNRLTRGWVNSKFEGRESEKCLLECDTFTLSHAMTNFTNL